MYKLVLSIITGILILITLCIAGFQPKMHKELFVYDSNYKIVESTPKTETIQTLPTQINPPQKQETIVKKEVTTIPQKETVKVQPTKTEQKTISRPIATKSVETQIQKPNKKEIEEEKVRQEVIMWNIWRSNLQNQIMSEVRLPIIPEGTVFKFSFDVDKYGKITNVQTYAIPSIFTPYAIQFIAPVIKSCQGREILNFPAGSNRISTTVEGGWRISNITKFSTPEDFKDSEKIIKKD